MDFDAFGARRGYLDPGQTWFPQPTPVTDRGYTGHQMLDGFDIIHMNGRIYDMRISRFLQPDPFVQEPDNAQNWNRYTYVWNNPLNATDPSGYLGQKERQWLGTIIMVVAIATQNYWVAAAGQAAPLIFATVGAVSGGIATQSTDGALVAAFTATLGGAMSGSMNGALAGAGEFTKFAARGMSGGILSGLQGGNFGHGFIAAGVGGAVGDAVEGMSRFGQVLIGALAGGTVSAATGGKFANGAVTAAMQFAVGMAANDDELDTPGAPRKEGGKINAENGLPQRTKLPRDSMAYRTLRQDFTEAEIDAVIWHQTDRTVPKGMAAITLGSDRVHVRPSSFDPHSEAGTRLIAHEMKHVRQILDAGGRGKFFRAYYREYRGIRNELREQGLSRSQAKAQAYERISFEVEAYRYEQAIRIIP